MEWQPIKTAPMDETPLLLFTPDVGICTGRYESFLKKWGVGPSFEGAFIWPGGSNPFSATSEPTHWMLLPARPETE